MKGILYTLLGVVMAACATGKPSCATGEAMSTDSTQTFATELFAAVNTMTEKENFCISPASAQWALAMTANGARGNTAKQMYEALGYPDAADNSQGFNCLQQKNIEALTCSEDAKISVANSIWASKDINLKKSFIEDNASFYDATVKNTNFDAEAIKEINSWCSDKTEGKITSIIDEAAPSTQLILINALHFKAKWMHPFYEEATYDGTFTKADGEKTTVQMMYQKRIAPFYQDTILKATARTFEGGEYSMILILPHKWSSIEKALDRFAEIYKGRFPGNKTYSVQLSMPKFKCEFGTSLKPMLKKMGVTDAFGETADFSGISKTPLLIDDVIQKSCIAVDESGTEAAATTAVMMVGMTARPMEKKEIILNRPFIYAITNNHTGEILFIGKVGNPKY